MLVGGRCWLLLAVACCFVVGGFVFSQEFLLKTAAAGSSFMSWSQSLLGSATKAPKSAEEKFGRAPRLGDLEIGRKPRGESCTPKRDPGNFEPSCRYAKIGVLGYGPQVFESFPWSGGNPCSCWGCPMFDHHTHSSQPPGFSSRGPGSPGRKTQKTPKRKVLQEDSMFQPFRRECCVRLSVPRLRMCFSRCSPDIFFYGDPEQGNGLIARFRVWAKRGLGSFADVIWGWTRTGWRK